MPAGSDGRRFNDWTRLQGTTHLVSNVIQSRLRITSSLPPHAIPLSNDTTLASKQRASNVPPQSHIVSTSLDAQLL